MKGGVIFPYLIIAFLLISHYPHVKAQSPCQSAPNPQGCMAVIKADPRPSLKSTPQGAAIILLDNAKANVKSTTAFINQNRKTISDKNVMAKFDACLQAYNGIGGALDVDPKALNDPTGRSDVVTTLTDTEQEVSYDCGQTELPVVPPVAKQLDTRVNAFSEAVIAAYTILSSVA